MIDTWLNVWEEGGEHFSAVATDEPRVDAAVSAYVDSGGTRDTLIRVTLADGTDYTVRASRIVSWAVSTPGTRRAAIEMEKRHEDERERFKQELGIWEDAS